jgi:xylulokinase
MSHYLGIDIGTFESKGVLVDGTGRIVAEARRPHRMLVPEPGRAEHRAREDWWGDLCAISTEILGKSGVAAGAIRAVGTSAIGPCMLPVDAAGEPLMNAILYGVDTRALREVADLTERIGAATVLSRCGNALTSQSVGPKILWLRRNRPDLYARTARVMTSTTYLVERLTGAFVIDHYSAAGFGPHYDLARRAWDEGLSEGIIETAKLPEPVWTTEVVGRVSARAAVETGLAEGTPVIAGTIDAAAEAASVGVSRPGDMMLMYGSTVFTLLVTAQAVTDPRLWYAPWLFPGAHASMAGLATSGTLTHWFRDNFGRDLDPALAFRVLAEEAAASPPGARGLILLPYFSGERSPIHDPLAKGVLFGLNLTHTRGDIYRATLEGIANATAHVMEAYAEAGQRPARVLAVGGGTKNAVWFQATSDITGLVQQVCATSIGASYGDAFLAACGVGDAQPNDIAAWNPVVSRSEPQHHPAYERQFAVYKALYERTRGLMATL